MHREPPPSLEEWVQDLAPDLGLDPGSVPSGLLLDLTREVAHGVVRPAGPVTTYLLGLAVAGGADPEETGAVVRARLAAWTAEHGQDEEKGDKDEEAPR